MEFTIPAKVYYSPQEIAELLSISPETIRSWIRSGKLKAIQLGSIYRITAKQINAFANHEVLPVVEIKAIKQEYSVPFNAIHYYKHNQKKVEDWKKKRLEKVNRKKRVLWYQMNLQDYVAYYHFVIKPLHEEHLGKDTGIAPSTTWLKEQNFHGYLRSFKEGYLGKYGVYTPGEFHKQILGIKTRR